MNVTIIDTEFAKYIAKPGIYQQMKITHQHQKLLRYHLRKGVPISLNKKLTLLQRAGWRQDQFQYTHEDLVAALKFSLQCAQSTRNMGAEYLAEKWLAQKQA